MMKNKLRSFMVLAALAVCFGTFSVTAYAQSNEPQTEPAPVEETTEPEETAEPNPFTPNGTGTVLDNATSEDEKEFYTIVTEDENVFYLVIDKQRDADNVYFLNAVTESDLMSLAEPDTEETTEPVEPEPEADPESDAAEAGENDRNALVMAHVRKYMEDNYMFDLSLDSVSEILHISPAYLSAQFKKYQKMNFLDCLTELRINAAKELLTDPFRSAAEVASMVGYEDSSYFARTFKKRTGMTPTQYRREAAKAAREARL